MNRIIAVVGFAGAGKTTAIKYLEGLGAGKRVYAGQLVLDEIRARGLVQNSQNERLVREDLREQRGPDAIAAHATGVAVSTIESGADALVDAILSPSELSCFQRCGAGPIFLLGIVASFESRAKRLQIRHERKVSTEDLRIRDAYELANLQTDVVLACAHFTITNEGTLSDFHAQLNHFFDSVQKPKKA